MKLNTNGNVYTFCYAAVMVIIVAFLLAFVASALKETQDANVANDTKGQILSALGYDKATIDVAAEYEKNVKDNVFADGELKPYEGSFNTTYGSLIKNGELHVFTATTAQGEQAYSCCGSRPLGRPLGLHRCERGEGQSARHLLLSRK